MVPPAWWGGNCFGVEMRRQRAFDLAVSCEALMEDGQVRRLAQVSVVLTEMVERISPTKVVRKIVFLVVHFNLRSILLL